MRRGALAFRPPALQLLSSLLDYRRKKRLRNHRLLYDDDDDASCHDDERSLTFTLPHNERPTAAVSPRPPHDDGLTRMDVTRRRAGRIAKAGKELGKGRGMYHGAT
jgi:hypothetical protein